MRPGFSFTAWLVLLATLLQWSGNWLMARPMLGEPIGLRQWGGVAPFSTRASSAASNR